MSGGVGGRGLGAPSYPIVLIVPFLGLMREGIYLNYVLSLFSAVPYWSERLVALASKEES